MGFLSGLGKVLGGIGSVVAAPFTAGTSLSWLPAVLGGIGAASSAIGGATQGAAQNRSSQLEASLLRDRLATERQAEDRAERSDAWKKLLNASYVLGSKGYTPSALNSPFSSMTSLPTYGLAPTGPPSANTLRGAAGLEQEVLRRLLGGSQLPPLTNVAAMGKMGGWEKLGNILGPALGVTGAVLRNVPRKSASTQIVSRTGQNYD